MGNCLGLAYAAFDTYILAGNAPWTFKHTSDHASLLYADSCKAIHYPKPDGNISFDKLTSVRYSNTNHAEDQPCHLQLKDSEAAISVNWSKYGFS